MTSDVKITEYGSSLRVQGLRVFVLHPSEAAALRAHFAAEFEAENEQLANSGLANGVLAAERMPEDVQALVDDARFAAHYSDVRAISPNLVDRLADALEAAYSKGDGDDPR